jgi:hypothetical protein
MRKLMRELAGEASGRNSWGKLKQELAHGRHSRVKFLAEIYGWKKLQKQA